MNRSFRAHDSPNLQMQPAMVKSRQQLRASLVDNGDIYEGRRKEKEDEQLALFLEMKKSEKEHNDLLNHNPDYFDSPLGSKSEAVPIFHIPPSTVTPARKTAADDFLNSDNDKSDYDWLLTPPGTPLFPYLEMESQRTMMNQLPSPKGRLPVLKSRVENSQADNVLRTSLTSKQTSSPSLSSAGLRRPSSSGGPASRPSTPTSRSTLPSNTKPVRSSTPTSRPSLSSRTNPVSKSAPGPVKTAPKLTSPGVKGSPTTSKTTFVGKPSSLTPSKPASSSSSKPAVSAPRSSTPTRPTPRSTTPAPRPTLPTKTATRSATPTRRPSVPPPGSVPTKSSPSITKPDPPPRTSVPSPRGVSPTPKARSWKPSDMPGYSHDAPPNLKTTVSDRTISSARGRPGAPSSRSSSIEPASNSRARRQSCSPSRGRAPNGYLHGGSVPALNRLNAKANDNISPVLRGTKMVERVINMRKLAPPRPDDKHSPHSNLSGKSSSPDSSGFGRTISKKSLDMAIRHMDIRRTLPGSLRPLMANIPASSMYSVRTGPARNRTSSITDSPVATSSNASSEVSYNNTANYLDSIEFEEEIGCERAGRSPLRGR